MQIVPKLRVVGSIPIARSNLSNGFRPSTSSAHQKGHSDAHVAIGQQRAGELAAFQFGFLW